MIVKDFITEYYFIYFCDIYWTTWIIFDYVINYYLRFDISEMLLWFPTCSMMSPFALQFNLI